MTINDASKIIEEICDELKMDYGRIISNSRITNYALTRQAIMVLLSRYTDLTLQKIGRVFNRHHATVIHAKTKHEERVYMASKGVEDKYVVIYSRVKDSFFKLLNKPAPFKGVIDLLLEGNRTRNKKILSLMSENRRLLQMLKHYNPNIKPVDYEYKIK